VENSGFGGFVAAPIATLMVEKYLNDTIQRKNLYDHMLSRDYIHKDTSSNGKTGEAGKNH
jgi:penicillin-binding protein 2